MIVLNGHNKQFMFNPYDPASKIGAGGMGVVFKGVESQTKRPVAIKVLFRNYAENSKVLAKTILTSRIRIQHENVVEILDFIEQDGKYHTVCEFLEGVTLDKLIKDGTIAQKTPNELLNMMSNVLCGIEALHNYKPAIIHRDITPSNIMICNSGRIAIMDFGIARVGQVNNIPNVTIVNNGRMLGTYHYSPPEQIHGRYSDINQTSDIYSAAITFYEMFTGHPPFDHSNTMEIMRKQVQEPLPYDAKIPMHVFKVLQKATQKQQYDRFQSISEFKDALGKSKPSWWKKLFN